MRKKPATGDEMSESDQTLGVKEDPDEANACLKHRTGFTPESDNADMGRVLMPCALDRNFMVKYHIVKELGFGSDGRLYEGILKRPQNYDQYVAIKIYEQAQSYRHSAQLATDEAMRYAALGPHPNLLKLLDKIIFKGFGHGFVEQTRVGLVFDRFDADLHQCCRRFQLGTRLMRRIMESVLKGLKFLHDSKVVHADLKPSNVLLRGTGACRDTVRQQILNSPDWLQFTNIEEEPKRSSVPSTVLQYMPEDIEVARITQQHQDT